MSPLPQPLLNGPRVQLRPFTTDDVEALFEIGSDPVVMRYGATPPWSSREQAAQKIAQFLENRQLGKGLAWALTRSGEERLFGYVTLFELDAEQRRATIGLALARNTHGQRLASESLPLALGFCFGALGLRRLEAEVDPENVASRKLLTRLGFVEEGLARERWDLEGRLSDSVCYGLLAREFLPPGP